MYILVSLISIFHFATIMQFMLFVESDPIVDQIDSIKNNRNLRSKPNDNSFQNKAYNVISNKRREMRLRSLLNTMSENPLTFNMTMNSNSPNHNQYSNAIFTTAFSEILLGFDANRFCATLRKTGYDGDVVVAVSMGMDQSYSKSFFDALHEMRVIIYEVPVQCSHFKGNDIKCKFIGLNHFASINMLRYFLYQRWSTSYSESSLILLSDFHDVFFQSNPFVYKLNEWYTPLRYQLLVYLEAHPNMAIERNVFNSGWVSQCYGQIALEGIQSNIISCSGNTLGTRNAIAAYSYLMNQQMDPEVRFGVNTTRTNQGCISTGMDQGFHNYLIYSGVLDKYLKVKIYPHGEGAVNVMGGFYGPAKLLKFNLTEWKILSGEKPNQLILNWDRSPAPVVHQLDRFLQSELSEGLEKYLKAFQP